ncbi:MAG: LysR family transcriptional regulator [Brevibacterium sp.]|uniref:LysR family transcriptional regulator n=1 Tax=Brevibacterium sandarakinum TaxID=629680 RepID=UPI002654B7F2|nr:LysR family transcriptional regulator [Brevibacterium sandarakinum]MDN5588111.1 LysR family transcriptional regulator [Brevibacterium sp.]MDN5634066.1 LysR family transcriptional regulator [Brevibacterium sp.]MDN5657032.1 LysR family transcriptional regulator [Brevibacterium sandarakinum]
MIDPRLITLRTFAACGTVAATAELTGYSPSAVSGQLRELQASLGMTLLTRDGRGLRLTATGRHLVRRSDRLIAEWEDIRASSLSAGDQSPTHFGIGGFSTASSNLLAPLAAHLRTSHPESSVHVTEASPTRCFELLIAERIDLAVVVSMQGDVQVEDDPRFEKVDLLDDPLDVMVPSDHRVATLESVTLAELAAEDWITAVPGSPYHALFIAAFTAAGVTPRISHESVEWETQAALVGVGVGVSLLPRLVSLAGEDNVTRVRLSGPGRLSRKIVAAVRAGSRSSPLIKESLRHLRATSQHILATRLGE